MKMIAPLGAWQLLLNLSMVALSEHVGNFRAALGVIDLPSVYGTLGPTLFLTFSMALFGLQGAG